MKLFEAQERLSGNTNSFFEEDMCIISKVQGVEKALLLFKTIYYIMIQYCLHYYLQTAVTVKTYEKETVAG